MLTCKSPRKVMLVLPPRTRGAAELHLQVLPPRLRAAAVVRLPGGQAASEAELSPSRGPVVRLPPSVPRARDAQGSGPQHPLPPVGRAAGSVQGEALARPNSA